MSRLDGFQVADVIDRVSPVARVVAESQLSAGTDEKLPAIITSTHRTSSVVTFAGDGLWKWSLLSPDNQDLAGFFDSLWSNLIRWLVVGSEFQPGVEVSTRQSRANIRVCEDVTFDIALKRPLASGADPKLVVKKLDGSIKQVPLKALTGSTPRLQGTCKVATAGVHEAVLDAPGLNPDKLVQKFNGYDATVERLNTAAKPVNLKMIAEQSNGRLFGPNDCDEFIQQLRADKEAAEIPPRAEYIWDRGWLMFVVVVIVGVEWIARKMSGLI